MKNIFQININKETKLQYISKNKTDSFYTGQYERNIQVATKKYFLRILRKVWMIFSRYSFQKIRVMFYQNCQYLQSCLSEKANVSNSFIPSFSLIYLNMFQQFISHFNFKVSSLKNVKFINKIVRVFLLNQAKNQIFYTLSSSLS